MLDLESTYTLIYKLQLVCHTFTINSHLLMIDSLGDPRTTQIQSHHSTIDQQCLKKSIALIQQFNEAMLYSFMTSIKIILQTKIALKRRTFL